MTRRDDIINHMARTLHLCAWADAAERDDSEPGHEQDWKPDSDTCAGAGQDWDNTVPEGASKAARELATECAAEVERLNGASLEALADVYQAAGGPDDARFAHSLAMVCLGHGVSPADDVSVRREYKDPEHPYREFYYFDAADAAESEG